QILPVSYKSELPKAALLNEPINKVEVADDLNQEQARRTASKFARGVLGDVEVVDTDSGQAIVAVSIKRKLATTSFKSPLRALWTLTALLALPGPPSWSMQMKMDIPK